MRNKPTLRVNSNPLRNGSGRVFVGDLGPDFIKRLSTERSDLLSSIFRVSVIQETSAGDVTLPDVSGRYQVVANEIEFIPHFPFEDGLKYRATFEPQPVCNFEFSEAATLDFAFSAERSAAPTAVSRIFPSAGFLPENLLRFYVCFSNSMQRGRAEEQISLLGPDGRPVLDALYRAPVELWNRSMRHLTVLVDPGRLKRWVGPNVALGPPMRAGQEYTLKIGSGMIDLYGRPLRESFQKDFRVEDPFRRPIQVEHWQMVCPPADSFEPFVLTFPRPLDWALLLSAIKIESTDGNRIAGQVVVGNCERTWSFTPVSPWVAQNYHVRAASGLEDICGNNMIAPFDRPLRASSNLTRESKECFLDFRPILSAS